MTANTKYFLLLNWNMGNEWPEVIEKAHEIAKDANISLIITAQEARLKDPNENDGGLVQITGKTKINKGMARIAVISGTELIKPETIVTDRMDIKLKRFTLTDRMGIKLKRFTLKDRVGIKLKGSVGAEIDTKNLKKAKDKDTVEEARLNIEKLLEQAWDDYLANEEGPDHRGHVLTVTAQQNYRTILKTVHAPSDDLSDQIDFLVNTILGEPVNDWDSLVEKANTYEIIVGDWNIRSIRCDGVTAINAADPQHPLCYKMIMRHLVPHTGDVDVNKDGSYFKRKGTDKSRQQKAQPDESRQKKAQEVLGNIELLSAGALDAFLHKRPHGNVKNLFKNYSDWLTDTELEEAKSCCDIIDSENKKHYSERESTGQYKNKLVKIYNVMWDRQKQSMQDYKDKLRTSIPNGSSTTLPNYQSILNGCRIDREPNWSPSRSVADTQSQKSDCYGVAPSIISTTQRKPAATSRYYDNYYSTNMG